MSEGAKTNTIVTASAGTGKTYRLVSEFVNAIIGLPVGQTPLHPRSILALTFTDKAAAEMRSRILARFSEINFGQASPRAFFRDLDQATITTYHSFCAKVLRDYSQILGIDKQFKLLDTFEEHELALKIAKRVVLRNLDPGSAGLFSLVARLGLEGRGDVKGVVGYLVRIREQLIENGVCPDSLPKSPSLPIAELLNSKEWSEFIRECDDAFNAYFEPGIKLSEIASKTISDARASYVDLKNTLDNAGDVSVEVKISAGFSRIRQNLSGRFGPDELRKRLLAALFQLGSELCASFVSLEDNAFRSLLKEFWNELESEKKSLMCLGFGDLLVLTRRLLRENLVARKELKARFKRVLVDEYQDTSPIQEDIVTLLCEKNGEERVLEGSQKALGAILFEAGKLFIVGDPKQSIYGFRGSDVKLFTRMREEIVAQSGACESLNVSRRSASAVVEIVNQVIECDENEKLAAMRESLPIAGALLVDPNEEKGIAAEIGDLLRGESRIAHGISFEPKDIAILVRRVKKAGPILRALTHQGIPAKIWGGEGFFERQEVIELASALALVANPENTVALLTVMRSPLMRFPDALWANLFERIQDANQKWTLPAVAKAVSDASFDKETSERVLRFEQVLSKVRKNIHLISAQEALSEILKNTDYLAEIAHEPEAHLCFANIEKLKGMLVLADGDFNGQIEQLSYKVRHSPKEAMGEEELASNAVKIMTIHQSKGLEFPVVFVADTSASIPSDSSDLIFDSDCGLALSHRGRPIAVCAPQGKEWIQRFATPIQSVRASSRAKNEAELSRLLYVALTRTRDFIYFTKPTDCDSHNPTNLRVKSLRNLFMAGISNAPDAVKMLFPELPSRQTIEQQARFEQKEKVSISIEVGAQTAVTQVERKLLFASDLLSTETASSTNLRSARLLCQPNHYLRRTDFSASEIGRLAHSLIADVAKLLTVEEYEDPDIIRQALDASLRINGVLDCGQLKPVVDNCVATLESVVWPLMKSQFAFRFEVPVLYENESRVVKGFVDAVATRGDIVCVIDFKSSRFAAESESTKLQLLTYCAALKDTDAQKIYYASCVIGERLELEFKSFDDVAHAELNHHLLDRDFSHHKP